MINWFNFGLFQTTIKLFKKKSKITPIHFVNIFAKILVKFYAVEPENSFVHSNIPIFTWTHFTETFSNSGVYLKLTTGCNFKWFDGTAPNVKVSFIHCHSLSTHQTEGSFNWVFWITFSQTFCSKTYSFPFLKWFKRSDKQKATIDLYFNRISSSIWYSPCPWYLKTVQWVYNTR